MMDDATNSKTVVVTGSTRGIGYGLADAFLGLGCQVVVSGRALSSVEGAVARLASKYEGDRILGHPCDVTQFEQVQRLWDAAKTRFGQVDVWINNAGAGHAQMDFWNVSPEQIRTVVETNLVGAMNGARVALSGMLEQGFGAIYNMEGLGSDGSRVAGLTLYGTTKSGLRYLTDALAQETKDTSLVVGALQPAMVVTDMLTGQFEGKPEEWERAKRIFNILADRVEAVAPWLAQRVLANTRNGARFKYLNGAKVMWRFLSAPFRKRDLFADDR
jgi:NAD(P)-dependent dehydrogenase (short-subunit alcohol dehydrogenase family)